MIMENVFNNKNNGHVHKLHQNHPIHHERPLKPRKPAERHKNEWRKTTKKKKKRNHSACRFWLNSDTPLMQETNCLEATSSFEPR